MAEIAAMPARRLGSWWSRVEEEEIGWVRTRVEQG